MLYAVKHLPTAEKDPHSCYFNLKPTPHGWEYVLGPKLGLFGSLYEANQHIAHHISTQLAQGASCSPEEFMPEKVEKRVRTPKA